MYHNINDLCRKIDVIKEKADKLRLAHDNGMVDTGFNSDPKLQFELDDIQALCRDIANDRGHF